MALAALPAQSFTPDRSRGAIPKKPPRMRWQRSMADADALAKATGQPLLLCVNMNFEPACEIMAHERYTDPAFAKLAEGFVALIACPDRHNPKDYDEQGRRIPCPRFGCVTCGEHIAVEPEMFTRFFNNRRVAPRHVGAMPDGKNLFDIFLTNELSVIDAALAKSGKARPADVRVPVESAVREQDEAKFASADRSARLATLQQIASNKLPATDIVRMGLRDADPGVREQARKTLAAIANAASQPLLIDLLDDEADLDARKALVPVLEKIADAKPETKLALKVYKAMCEPAKSLQPKAWLDALARAKPAAESADEDLDAKIDELTAKAGKADAGVDTLVELGTATLRFARQRIAAGRDAQFLLDDAQAAAKKAIAKAAKDAGANALAAEVAQMLGQRDVALTHARVALPQLLKKGDVGSSSVAGVLAGLAEGATAAIYAAEGKKAAWDGELLAEADSAYRVLAAHPFGTAAQAAAHVDLLGFLGLRGELGAALTRAIQRFPADVGLHDRLRNHVSATRGMPALTEVYAELGKNVSDRASHQWFVGRAELALAEHHKREGDDRAADAAYARSVAAFLESQSLNAGYAESAIWYASMGLAGRARVTLDLGDPVAAAKLIGEAIARQPNLAEQEDGLGRTALFTLKQVLQRLDEKSLTEPKAELEKTLSQAAPDVWRKATGG